MIRFARPQVPFNPAYRARFAGAGAVDLNEGRRLPPAPLAPSQPLGPGAENMGELVRLPGANFPPAGSRGVDTVGDADIAPGASATLLTVTTPDNMRFRIVGIGFGADDEVALGFLTWSIRLGPDPAPGYESEAAAVGSVRNLADIFVNVGSSIVVGVLVTSDPSAVLTYRFIARIRGYFYTEEGAR
jgi:hypothetical protein